MTAWTRCETPISATKAFHMALCQQSIGKAMVLFLGSLWTLWSAWGPFVLAVALLVICGNFIIKIEVTLFYTHAKQWIWLTYIRYFFKLYSRFLDITKNYSRAVCNFVFLGNRGYIITNHMIWNVSHKNKKRRISAFFHKKVAVKTVNEEVGRTFWGAC